MILCACRLLKFVKEVGLPDTEKPSAIPGSYKSRVRSTVMLAGRKLVDDQVDHRSEQPEGMAARASREPAHRDKVPQEQEKSRSRSPAARVPITKRVTRAGQHLLFSDAMRKVEGSSSEMAQNQLTIKQEPGSPDVVVLDAPGQEIKPEAAAQQEPHGRQPLAERLHASANGGAREAEMQTARSPEEYDQASVVITNVHFEATPEQVGLFFHERCGNVIRVTILKNSHGMPKGVAASV